MGVRVVQATKYILAISERLYRTLSERADALKEGAYSIPYDSGTVLPMMVEFYRDA